MKARRDLDAFLAFLAGAAAGAALTRWYLGPAWPPFAAPSPDAQRQGATAASIGRIQSLLGEIRGLMRAPAQGPGEASPSGASAPRSAPGPAPRMPEPGVAGAGHTEGAEGIRAEAPAAGPASAGIGGRGRAEDAWRRPDQIGYGRRPMAARLPDPGAAGAAILAGAGAVAAFAMLRRGGAAAAWAAAGGVVAASLWSAWRGGAAAGRRAGQAGTGAWIDGRRGRRRGRPAVR